MDLYAKVICQIMDLRSDLLDAASQYHDYRESSTTNSEHLAFDIVVRRIPKIIENIASDRNRDYIVKGSMNLEKNLQFIFCRVSHSRSLDSRARSCGDQ